MPDKIDKYSGELKAVFKHARDKHEANYQSAAVMAEMSADDALLSDILRRHIDKVGSFNTLHYPVIGIDIDLNEDFGLVANCWIPLPDRATNVSTKAIHHHGDMLLTTATAFGPGYEHWTFATPSVVDRDKEIFDIKLLECELHPRNHVAFVDAFIAHLPLYPPDATVTYALWSSRFPTTWKDRVKRNEFLQRNKASLKKFAGRLGLTRKLDLKVVEYFDFYPSSDGFRGIKDRREFERSNNEDYLASFFYILQVTGNEHLAADVRRKLKSNEKIDNRDLVHAHLGDLESGKEIAGRLSEGHFGVDGANFTKDEILGALSGQGLR